MKNSFKVALLLVAAGIPCLFSLNAKANSITLGNVSEVNDISGGSDWTFSFSFDNSSLKTGDYFTIMDFGAATIVSGPAAPVGGTWTFSQALVGPNPFPAGVATDYPNILNATFTWSSSAPVTVGNQGPYTFTLHSDLSVSAIMQTDDYVSIDQSASDGSDSRVVGPLFGPNTVPDGGLTVAFLGFALVGIEGLRRKLLCN